MARHRRGPDNRLGRPARDALLVHTRFENQPGTNPEELIAAAHAGCFTMALAFQLQTAGYTPAELATQAAVSLDPTAPASRSPGRP